jgi:hypothetical protein
MELDQFISGERFQALADISFIPYGGGNGESECGFVQEQQRNNMYNAFYYNDDTIILPDLTNVKTIFVNTWTLDRFFSVIFPLLPGKYTFISHNSDLGISEKHRPFLDSEKIIKWFSQNTYIEHSKLISLPIGLGNQQYPHGNLELIKNIIERQLSKELLVFKNFDSNTNYGERAYVDKVTTINNIPMWPHLSQEEYFTRLSQSAFVISPPGNGIDCHRIWESLYFKTIPIVKRHPCFKQYEALPILFIDSWEGITEEFLRKEFRRFQFNDIQQLNLDYWRDLIYHSGY